MFDLDSETDLEESNYFKKQLAIQAVNEDPFRFIIGQWIAKGFLNRPQAMSILFSFDCYKEVSLAAQRMHLPLTLWIVEYLHNNKPKKPTGMDGVDLFLYRAQQAMLVISAYFTLEEQAKLLRALQNVEKKLVTGLTDRPI